MNVLLPYDASFILNCRVFVFVYLSDAHRVNHENGQQINKRMNERTKLKRIERHHRFLVYLFLLFFLLLLLGLLVIGRDIHKCLLCWESEREPIKGIFIYDFVWCRKFSFYVRIMSNKNREK